MRGNRLVLLGVIAIAAACGRSRSVSNTGSSLPPAPVIQVTIEGVSVENGHVVARYTITKDGSGVSGSTASGYRPSWTLAVLGTDPVSGIKAWQSLLLTGSQTLTSLPIEGPGTPSGSVLSGVKQPGSDTGGTVQDAGGGQFTYTFAAPLPAGQDPGKTLRVGVYLSGTPGTAQTSSTFDFVPSGGPVESRELVLDASCEKCHGVIQAHGGFRTGTRLCVTCHTYQDADPDTQDPASLSTDTAQTNPNPLDLGRLVHRIHRGETLPTLYDATSGDPVVGRKYSVVGFQSRETVYGQIENRSTNGQPATPVAVGVAYPQDLRDCLTCHGGAAQGGSRFTDVSRRTCGGCHPDVWFQDPAAIPPGDLVHTAHPGGPQADDTACAGCHVPTADHPTVLADITDIHVTPTKSPHWNGLTAQIVSIQGMTPGGTPTVTFTLRDRDGTPSPLGKPTPATDATSPVPRALQIVNLTVSGPTAPDYLTGNTPITEAVPVTTAADAQGQFSYTFKKAIPAGATGTWAVALEARRAAATADTAWPFTGERINEWADNPVEYVDVGTGAFPGGDAVMRRQVVSRDQCNACHGELSAHGDLRHAIEYCVMCHTPDATDWAQRPRNAAGNTDLSKTFDDIEERSIHFKALIHRLHTGNRTGSAELDLAPPMVVYGFMGSVNFLGDVEFPGDLARCTLCHVGKTYRIESIPAGAAPTVANENPTLLHRSAAAHATGEPSLLPITSACLGCHDTGAALTHAQTNTINGKEQCQVCHGANGFMAVDMVHGL